MATMSSLTDHQRRNSMDIPPRMISSHDATLIDPGPPTHYQLNTVRRQMDGNHGKIRRCIYGQKPQNKQNKVLLMVGETGAGKTTLINTMINYILGVKFEDQEWYQITEEEKQDDQTQSQTSEVTVYEVFVEENPTSLTIIDTPGYGDTGGYEKDREISEYLRRLFSDKDGVDYIDAVCFVMKASQNRLSGKELYIFHSVLSLFGSDIENNIVFIITHSDERRPTDALDVIRIAQIPCKRDVKKQPVHFLFNNQQKEKRDGQNKYVLKSAWEMGERSMSEFFAILEEKNRKSVQMTLDVLNARRRLEASVCDLKQRTSEKEIKMKELTEIQETLRQNRDKIMYLENIQFTVKTAVKEKVCTHNEWWWNRNPTCCYMCEENCHENCWENEPSSCEVMKKNHCTKCTGKCHYSEHVKENKKYVLKRKTVTMTFDALKQDYERTGEKPKTSFDKKMFENITKEHEKTTKEFDNNLEIEAKLNTDLETIKSETSKLLEEAFIPIMRLSEIALKADSAFTLQHLDLLIPELKEEGKDEWMKTLEDLRKAGDEQKNKGALRQVLEFTGKIYDQSDRRVTAVMAPSRLSLRRKSLDEPPEKIAGVIRLKDEFVELYERDQPWLQQCAERMNDNVDAFGKAYIHATEGSRIAGWMGMGGVAVMLAGLALMLFSQGDLSVPLAIFVASFGALALTNYERTPGWMGMVVLVLVLILISFHLRSFLFAFASAIAIYGVVGLKTAGYISGHCSSEKKRQMRKLKKGIEAELKEFQDKINPMAEKIKELLEHTEKILREQDAIWMEDIDELTTQMSKTTHSIESIAVDDGIFSLVIDIFSVFENNSVLDEMNNLAANPINEEVDEHGMTTKVGKFIVEIKKEINQLQYIVDELQKTQDQLAVY